MGFFADRRLSAMANDAAARSGLALHGLEPRPELPRVAVHALQIGEQPARINSPDTQDVQRHAAFYGEHGSIEAETKTPQSSSERRSATG